MKIAVASGKGGTGKTTVATSLAYVAAQAGEDVAYLDCDVEEPNGAIFLKPEIEQISPVNLSVPTIDADKCTGCGKCGQICQFSAILPMDKHVLTFPELCHGCGGCWLVCPTGAIAESHRQVGRLETGRAGAIRFVAGLLNIGQPMSPPVIRRVKAAAPAEGLVVIDSPPGTSCPVIESVRDTDFVAMVTEPTPFGLHDLKLAVEMVRAIKLPFGVILNRADLGDGQTRSYCRMNHIDILAEIPNDREIAEAYSRGELIPVAVPRYEPVFEKLLNRIASEVQAGA